MDQKGTEQPNQQEPTDKELYDKFRESKTPEKEMTPEQIERLMPYLTGESKFEEAEEPKDGETDTEPKKEDEPKEEVELEPEKKDKSYVPGEKYFKKANEANQWKRQLEAEQKRKKEIADELERLKQSRQEAENRKFEEPNDLWEDSHQRAMAEKVQKLEAKLEQFSKANEERLLAEQKKIEQLERELQAKAEYEEYHELQNQFTDLKTETKLEDLDKQFNGWFEKVGSEGYHRYFSDPEFRKQKESEGLRFPGKDEREQNAYRKLLELHTVKKKHGYPTARAAYLDKFWDTNSSVEQKNESAEAQKRAEAEKSYKFNQTPTLPDGAAGGDGSSRYSLDQIERWLAENPNPNPTREPEKFKKTQEMLDALRSMTV